MARNVAYRIAEQKIEEARRTKAKELDLSYHGWPDRLTELPKALAQFAESLQSLDLSGNRLRSVPEWLGRLTKLRSLNLSDNQLTELPEALGKLTQLQALKLSRNQMPALPDCIRHLKSLRVLWHETGTLTSLPSWLPELKELVDFTVYQNNLTDLPSWMADVVARCSDRFSINGNPLNPELAAANNEGREAVIRYLRAKAEAHVVLNEAKLIVIGEGEVGKSCLLGALRGDPWEEGRPTTHGIEIKPVKLTDPDTGIEITLNGWDFGGQRVYRPTHQLFFSAAAVYLVAWKPREGPQQGFVKEWIKLVKHREPGAKLLVVATHGGPTDRQPDIDRQEIWDLFGKDTVIDFFHVDSRPSQNDKKTGKPIGARKGIGELKDAIARVATSLPEMGRSVPKHWNEARMALANRADAYLPLDQALAICKEHKIEEEDARLLLRICHRVGDLIHYEHDPALHNIVVLKPDWLATAISFVLDDKQTREGHGLVSFHRLEELWNDPARAQEFQYDPRLHPLFLRLMERFDLSYKVALPSDAADAIGIWERIGNAFKKAGAGKAVMPEIRYTSLIAQLVPDIRPEQDMKRVWSKAPGDGDEQQLQICRIVDAKNAQSASAEGLFYQLIVRLHRFSLGRMNFKDSVHWQRGLVLDDEYNGRALLEYVGNDVRITVRAAYPEKFLSVLTRDVEWLVENFWEGLRCDVMVPCIEPCGLKAPGTGLFEVKKLIESKRGKRPEYPCPVCNEWQGIDHLLRNAPAARRDPLTELLASFHSVKDEVHAIRPLLREQQGEVMRRFDASEARILSRVDDAFTGLMTALTDEAKEGPRLFSFEPVERSKFNLKSWVSTKFRVTLWCEHSRVPLPLLNKQAPKQGVYEFDLSREWFVQAAPFLIVLSATLRLVLPVAASAIKLALDETAYKAMEKELDFGKECAEAIFKTGEKAAAEWIGETEGRVLEREQGLPPGGATRAQGAVLRQMQAWLKEKDSGFGGLVRVQNKRQEFLWVHPKFQGEY